MRRFDNAGLRQDVGFGSATGVLFYFDIKKPAGIYPAGSNIHDNSNFLAVGLTEQEIRMCF
jgi:hypothetical protein